jgi:hypothetical protein
MFTILCDFCQFSAKKIAFFSKNNVMITIFAKFFGENILKIITSVLGWRFFCHTYVVRSTNVRGRRLFDRRIFALCRRSTNIRSTNLRVDKKSFGRIVDFLKSTPDGKPAQPSGRRIGPAALVSSGRRDRSSGLALRRPPLPHPRRQRQNLVIRCGVGFYYRNLSTT